MDVAALVSGHRCFPLHLWETTEEDLLDVVTKGVWNTAAVTIPAMLAAYTAAKHAVVGIVKGLAADLVGTGITANAVSPGSTDTDMLRTTASLYDVPTDELVSHQLIRRIIDPAEIAAAIAFCASPAGGVVNGTVLHADGGFGG